MMARTRCAVVIGQGDFSAVLAQPAGEAGPRLEFVEIARATDADLVSFTTGAGEHGGWFRRLFADRPNWGAAFHAACVGHRYDAMYVTGEDIALPLALLLRLRGWRGRLVCVAHRVTPLRARLFRLVGHRAFHRVVTVSRAQAAVLVTQAGYPAAHVRAMHNWVDDRFFDPRAVTSLAEVEFVACGAENRDYAGLRRAFATMPQHALRIFGHGFFGAGPASVGPRNVVAMPRVAVATLRDFYGSARAVIVPLNDVDYAAGVTGLIEAMACGRPVIATETVGIREYLDHVDPRLSVRPGDAGGLANAVRVLADSPAATRDAWGRANRAWVMGHCRLDDYVMIIRGEMIDR